MDRQSLKTLTQTHGTVRVATNDATVIIGKTMLENNNKEQQNGIIQIPQYLAPYMSEVFGTSDLLVIAKMWFSFTRSTRRETIRELKEVYAKHKKSEMSS